MKLHPARCVALLLAALVATAGAAHAQQYPYQYTNYADEAQEAPPPPGAGTGVAPGMAQPMMAPPAPGMGMQPPMGDGQVGGYQAAQEYAGGQGDRSEPHDHRHPGRHTS